MRFLLSIYKYFPTGGLQKDALRIAIAACQAGHQIVFFTTSWEGSKPSINGLEIKLATKPSAWTNLGRMNQFAKMVANERKNCYDCEIAMNRIPGARLYFAGDECMKTLVERKHSTLVRALFPRYHAILKQEKDTLLSPETQKILLISPLQKTDFQREYALPDERFELLPPGLDEGSLPPASQAEQLALRKQERETLGLNDDDIMVLMVSSSFRLKGVDRALLAIASLPTELRKKCHAVLIGRNDERKFLDLAETSGIFPAKATALPPRDSVGALYLAGDVMLHPARSEGAGSVLIEAVANGLPVICTGICGFAPLVSPAGLPIILEPFSQDSLNKEFLQVLNDLPEYKNKTREYGSSQDFCGRAKHIVNLLERDASK